MPESGRRVYATHTGRFSKTVAAPMRYVYDWCTDFRTDDGKYSGSRSIHRVVQVSPERLVRVRFVRGTGRNPRMGVDVVRLNPPNAWHKDNIGETDLDSVDYKLTALGPKKTRISLVLVERWMVPKFPKKAEWLRDASEYWDDLVAAIEQRYRSGKRAKG